MNLISTLLNMTLRDKKTYANCSWSIAAKPMYRKLAQSEDYLLHTLTQRWQWWFSQSATCTSGVTCNIRLQWNGLSEGQRLHFTATPKARQAFTVRLTYGRLLISAFVHQRREHFKNTDHLLQRTQSAKIILKTFVVLFETNKQTIKPQGFCFVLSKFLSSAALEASTCCSSPDGNMSPINIGGKKMKDDSSVTSHCAQSCIHIASNHISGGNTGVSWITIFHRTRGCCLPVFSQGFPHMLHWGWSLCVCVCWDYKAVKICQSLCGGHMAMPWARSIMVGVGMGWSVYYMCMCVYVCDGVNPWQW